MAFRSAVKQKTFHMNAYCKQNVIGPYSLCRHARYASASYVVDLAGMALYLCGTVVMLLQLIRFAKIANPAMLPYQNASITYLRLLS